MLCKMNGLQCSINSPEIKRGSISIELDEDHLSPPMLCSREPRRTILHISLVGGGSHHILSQLW